jgi:hypothetical protein
VWQRANTMEAFLCPLLEMNDTQAEVNSTQD